MTYNKPTIEVLGEAVSVIHGYKIGPSPVDGDLTVGTFTNPPAYELDE